MPILGPAQLSLPPDGREALFLLRWTAWAEARLEDLLGEDGPLTREGALRYCTELLRQLRELSEGVFGEAKRAYIAEEAPLLGLAPGLASQELRAAASEWLLRELERTEGGCVFEPWPLLRELLDRHTERFAETARELLSRLRRDWPDIARCFFGGADPGRITDIHPEAGDPHFHGRSTCVIGTERGRFVYKPRDCRIDAAFRGLLELGFGDFLKAPRCLARQGYGYCAYITPDEVAGREDIARFFRRFGGACALLQALGSSDLHAENWICSGGWPVLIDLETVLTPVPRVFSDRRAFPELVREEGTFLFDANRSLLPSGVLPALTGGGEQSVLLCDAPQARCLPVWEGRRYTVLGYEEPFLSGFAEGYRRCMERGAALRTALEGFRELPVRRLVRSTAGYDALLRRLRSPEALRSERDRRAVTDRLDTFFRARGAGHMLPVARWEADCLLEGDIPCFQVLGGGRDLLGYGEVVAADFFARSGVENGAERVGRLSEAEGRFELALLRQGLLRAAVPVPPAEEAELPGPPAALEPLGREEALREAETLFRLVEGLMLTGPGGKSSWLTMADGRARLTPAEPAFSQGTAGLGVFFAAVHAAGGGPAARAGELAEVCLEQLADMASLLEEARRIPEQALPLGLSRGWGGALRALTEMERLLGTGRAGRIRDRMLALLEKADVEEGTRLDVYSGAAGLLLPLCRVYEETGSGTALRHLRRAAERLLQGRTLAYRGLLLWDTMEKSRPISGAGHGMAGIAAALSRAWRVLGDDRCRQAAWDALSFEHGIYDRELGGWPDLRASPAARTAMHGLCSGAPGVGLALGCCRESGLEPPWLAEDLERARHSCLAHPPLFRDHLCCGNSSAVEFLLTQPDCREQAGRLLAFMKARKESSGGYRYLPPDFQAAPSPDLFFGAAGVGYALLRYAEPERFRQLLF